MWYIPNVRSIQEMNPAQKSLFKTIFNNEPFFIGLNLKARFYRSLNAIELIVNNEEAKIYFAYPSSSQSKFASLQSGLFAKYYERTFETFYVENKTRTAFQEENIYRICSPYFKN